ncbi:MAG TPA: radical SAM family heme chaperone HemW [Candidatus Limnocylindrales bacterium]
MTVPAPVALYVHFPFCLSICPYCDFVVYGGRAARRPDSQVARSVDALITELELRGRAARLGSVYLGGGTPSLLPPQEVGRILGAADDSFGIDSDAEITLEVNPGPADRGDLAGFVAAGVNRISVGAQSMDAGELQRLGRRHSAPDVATTVAQARSAAVRSVSVDLLYDVPGQTLASWRASLDVTLALEPDHVSAYALTLPEADGAGDHLRPSPGAARWRARARHEQDDDRAADMYELADERLARAGLDWYEISNWARPGHASRHNQVYWQGGAWEAVGPGAHAFDGVATRRWSAASLELYLAALEAGRLPLGGNSVSAESVAAAESVVLRLRTASGVDLADLGSDVAEWAAHNGLIEPTAGERVRLTRRGRLLSNELFERLMPAPRTAVA